MLIDAIDVYHLAHPMREAWSTAYGSDEAVHGVFVRLRSGEHEGWGESNPLEHPTYTPEYAAGAFETVARLFAPLIVGRDMETADSVGDALAEFRGNQFAKSALEIAWWALQSSVTQTPLYALLGGTLHDVEVGEAFGLTDSMDDLLGRIERATASGYTRIKLKVRPERDLDVLRQVRNAFPAVRFHIDGNCGYTLRDLPMFEKLDKLGLMMIEQPLQYGDLVDHAKLQRAIETPICLDESCNSISAAAAAIELGSCKIMNIKPPRVGGLSNSRRILELCRQAAMPAWVGSMLETSIGTVSNLAFATLRGVTLPCDAFPSQRFYDQEITALPTVLSGPGRMRPPDAPASEYLPLAQQVRERTIRHVEVRATAGRR
jgi:O-succinylbenzoate synthase